MKHTFGTDFIGGLNVGKAAHKIDPSEVTVSENGWTDEEGVWRTMPGPTTLYTGYTNIKAMAAGRMGGADHVVWLDGSTLYDNGSSVGTLATTSPTIRDFDDKFFIMGADDGKNYVYDGDLLREAGAPQATDELYDRGMSPLVPGVANSAAVSAITKAPNARVTVGSAHPLVVGQTAYITGGDMTEIVGVAHTVTAIDEATYLWFEIDVDSSTFTTYTTGATVYYAASGLSGTYKFYATTFVRFADGTVAEGNPVPLGELDELSGKTWDDSWGAKEYSLSPTYPISFLGAILSGSDWLEYDVSGTMDVDWFPGVRLYRTKADGADYYLEREFVSPGDDVSDIQYGIRVPDYQLGAVYTPGSTDRASHPQSSIMALAAQRLWMNDLDNPTFLYYTSLDGTMYVPALNYLDFPDDITAIGSAGDVVVVFSSDRMWRVSLLGGFPDVDEIKTPVGTTYGNALALTDLGLLFLRDDGLWATDGASSPNIVSRRAFATLDGPVNVAASGDTLALTDGVSLYVMRRRDGGTYWHGPGVTYNYIDATGGTFYAADANSIYSLFTGVRYSGALESPDLTIRQELKALRVVLDVDGDSIPAVWVNGNRYSDYDGHADDGTGRRLVRLSIPRLLNHVFRVRVELSGDSAVYGYWLECE